MPEAAPLLTILTPTYNRAYCLGALRASLAAQEFRDFEWLVVDDGSTDGTLELLASWAADGGLAPRTITGRNGGKHRALNRGVPEARGRWTFIVDSDDQLPPGALAAAAAAIPEAEADAAIGGIMGLRVRPDGSLIGERLPAGVRAMDAAALTFTAGLRGDKAELFKTEVLRAFPFPELEGEKFLTECVVWFRIARAGYKLLLLDEPIYVCDYREDGLSAKSLSLRLRNPKGTLLFYREELALGFPRRALFREAANYVRFAIHAGRFGEALRELEPRGRRLAILAAPLGLAAAILDRAKGAGPA